MGNRVKNQKIRVLKDANTKITFLTNIIVRKVIKNQKYPDPGFNVL